MQCITVNGRELAIGFDFASQGFRMTAWEYINEEWQDIDGYRDVLCLMQTQFEALCGLASELFDDAVWAESMALKLDIPIVFSDDDYDCYCGDCDASVEAVN